MTFKEEKEMSKDWKKRVINGRKGKKRKAEIKSRGMRSHQWHHSFFLTDLGPEYEGYWSVATAI